MRWPAYTASQASDQVAGEPAVAAASTASKKREERCLVFLSLFPHTARDGVKWSLPLSEVKSRRGLASSLPFSRRQDYWIRCTLLADAPEDTY